MTRTSDTVRTHLQRCRTLGEGLLKLCAHQTHTQAVHTDFSPHRRSIYSRNCARIRMRAKNVILFACAMRVSMAIWRGGALFGQ